MSFDKSIEYETTVAEKEPEIAPRPGPIGIRHLQAFLIFLGLVVAYGVRVSMSVGIVAMTDSNSSTADVQTFPWERSTKDTILSSFFWGYIISQVPAGIIAERFGGKLLLLISLTGNGIIAILIPLAAVNGGWGAVCACRVFQGLFQGFFYPSTHAILGKWAPPAERGRLSTYIYAGAQFGTVVALPLAGELCGGAWGWPSVFYTMGIAAIVWAVLWFFLGADTPANSRLISKAERDYIQTSLGQDGEVKHHPTPWKSIFTSLPVWALIVVHCGQNWGFWMLLTEMPSYMGSVLGVDIKSNGLLSALPYLVMWILSFVVSFISDYVINNKIVSVTVARKVANTIGHWGPGLALIGLSYTPADVTTAVGLLTLTVGLNAGHYVGFQVNHIDLAPNFAGVLMGITNGCANILSIIAPLSVGFFISPENESEASAWRPIFFLSAAIYFLFNLFWLLFGTCELQPWNDPEYNKNKEDIEKNKKETKAKDKANKENEKY
ncbi:putative inorganic phosphate cotransporter [Arctopsyche grandis]|uniref:putative inorganic phosphate cotransporter n=1 Tax=Arctopsyche grandis TaxID=121162 RepID=UPI00406D93E8